MQSIILYGSKRKLTKAHKPVHSASLPPTGSGQPDYYVRMKVVHTDFLTALSKAKPMPGETVLNTVPI